MPDDGDRGHCPTLNPRDVTQLAYVLEEIVGMSTGKEEDDKAPNSNKSLAGRDEKSIALGQLSIRWRGPMGEKGTLKTGLLTAQKA